MRSTDAGTTWSFPTSGTSERLTSVSFGDDNTGTAVGEGGTIIRTIDRGVTWSAQDGGTTRWLEGVSFVEANVGTAVGDNGTILRTTDGGSTWTSQQSGTTQNLQGVFFTDVSLGTAVGANGTILRTTDGGTTWNFQVNPSRLTLYGVWFNDENRGSAVGRSGTILRTLDGGITWTSQAIGVQHLYGVCFAGADSGTIVGGGGTILRTTDAGATWLLQPTETLETFNAISLDNANTGTIAGVDGSILRTTNGGDTWVFQAQGSFAGSFYDVWFTDPLTGTFVGQYGTIVHTTNSGFIWTIQPSPVTSWLYGIWFMDDSTAICIGAGGAVLRTTDGGGTWNGQSNGIQEDLKDLAFIDASTGTVVGSDGIILRTTDGGNSWKRQTSGTTVDLTGVSFTDADTGTAVGWRTILRTTNGGNSWVDQSVGVACDWLYDVCLTDGLTGTVVGNCGLILKTTDGGETWISQASGTSSALLGVTFIDPNIGTIVGGTILRTTNGGITWTAQGGGGQGHFFIDANIGFAVGGSFIYTTTGGTGIDPPSAPTPLLPLDGSVISSFPIVISWSPSSGAIWYTLQVSTNRYFASYVFNEANIPEASYELGDLQNGMTYYWRVSMTDSLGTSGWSEIWSFTTSVFPSLPSQVILIAPEDETKVSSDSVNLQWHQSFPEVNRYWLEGATDSLFATPFIDSLLIDTVRTVGFLEHNETYWWKVRAHNDVGWGSFSDVWSFFVFQEVPASPMLVSPPDSAFGISTSPILRWNPSLGANSYSLQLSDTSDFSSFVVDDDSLTETALKVTGLSNNDIYYWRVSASNDSGTSDWSEVWSFRTFVQLPEQVLLLFPENGTLIVADSVLFAWHQTAPDVDRYWFELSTDSSFTGATIDSTITDTAHAAYQLSDGSEFLWRVRAHNAAGWGPFSEPWSFHVLIESVREEDQVPTEFSLSQNYPNPFNPSTVIRYGLPERSHVRLEVFNLLGEKIVLLVDDEKAAGYHEVILEGERLSTGMYFYRVRANQFVDTKKLLILR